MRTIAIVVVALSFVHSGAAAQTAAERAVVLRDFQQSVIGYTQQRPHALLEATPVVRTARRIFTPPVAMVFRQLIARSLQCRDGVPAMTHAGAYPQAEALAPFPSTWLLEFPRVLQDALPPLPAPLEYRLIGDDLAIRDAEADIVVDVLRNAVGPALNAIR